MISEFKEKLSDFAFSLSLPPFKQQKGSLTISPQSQDNLLSSKFMSRLYRSSIWRISKHTNCRKWSARVNKISYFLYSQKTFYLFFYYFLFGENQKFLPTFVLLLMYARLYFFVLVAFLYFSIRQWFIKNTFSSLYFIYLAIYTYINVVTKTSFWFYVWSCFVWLDRIGNQKGSQ